MHLSLDIDTGGTFTDGFLTADERVELIKVETTPHDLTVCFLDCIEEAARRLDLTVEELLSRMSILRYSTTVGTNCLLQRRGPKLGLIVTHGHAQDLYAEGDAGSESLETLESIVMSGMRVEAKEAVDGDGNVVEPLDAESLRGVVENLLDSGALGIVVSLNNSAVNPGHEYTAKAVIDGEYPRHYLGSVPVLVASAVTAHTGDHVRTNTALLNAYIHRDMVRYLYRADELLRQRGYRKPLLIAHSSGGAARVAKTTALNTYNSGPAAGLIGCSKIANDFYGIDDFVSVDVGGTSVDIGVGTGGRVTAEKEPLVEGLRIGLPMITLGTAAGGGGSIARVDFATNAVTVGPESAGALPGPVCYDLGGVEPTVTDADLVLGFLDEGYFLGGRKKVVKEKAREALSSMIAGSLGIPVEAAAWKVVQATEDDVARRIDEQLKAGGIEAGGLTMFAFGGGGGLRCCGYASRLGIQKVIVFGYNAVASAFGASTMDVLHIYERPARITLRSASGSYLAAEWKEFNKAIADMVASAKRDMRGEGFAPDTLSFTLELGVRAKGGFRWIESPLVYLEQEDEARRLADLYEAESGGDSGEMLIERVTLKAECPVPHYRMPSHLIQGQDPGAAQKGVREVYWGEGYIGTQVYERDRLQAGNRVEGPAIVEAPDTTYLVYPGWAYTVDQYLNGLLEVVR